MIEELAIASQQVETQRQRQREISQISMMVGHECKKQFAVERKGGCASPLKGEALREYNQNMHTCLSPPSADGRWTKPLSR
jgi:hypothetical protein